MKLRLASRWAVISLVVVVALIAIFHQAIVARSTSAPVAAHPTPTLTGGDVLYGNVAPAFSLKDEQGQTISLAAQRGHPVVLTFMDATCTSECPITAQFMDETGQFLGAKASQVAWLVITVNPNNTPADVEHFLKKNNVQVNLHMLLGAQAQLAPLWKAYGIYVQPSPTDVAHTVALYLIDQQGHERMLFGPGFDPKALANDISILMNG